MGDRLTPGQRIVQLCPLLVAAIAITGGALQMYLGQPDTAPRLDNIHRFMAGVSFDRDHQPVGGADGPAAGNARAADRAGGAAGGDRPADLDRASGLPEPAALWLAYLVPNCCSRSSSPRLTWGKRRVRSER